jgi:hypothetical protein
MSKTPISRTGIVTGLLTLLIAAFVPCSGRASTLTLLGTATADGYTFFNFDGPNAGSAAGAGTNVNGISNSGSTVGFDIENNGTLANFVTSSFSSLTNLDIGGSLNAQAFGINSGGTVVGTVNGTAFALPNALPNGGSVQTVAIPNSLAATAFGINDNGNIVGQFLLANGAMPGFFVASSAANGLVIIDAPSGPNIVNAQGVNNQGMVAGFYVGVDGQYHGFTGNIANAQNGFLTGTAIADPTIPNVAGEPGATFVFSQILGINDGGLTVGYYGDSTASEHGYIYNTNTGTYTFLDDPSEAFDNGVEVTQITGINNAGDIAGFYSDSNGIFHGFIACPTGTTCPAASAASPEPGCLVLGSSGLVILGFGCFRRRKKCAE